VPRSGPDRNLRGFKHVRKFLIALSIATVTFGITAITALAGPSGPCCYS